MQSQNGLELLDKANGILKELELARECSVQELSAACGEPVSSIYRLLASLQAIGWVDRGITRGQYRLGLYAVRIGAIIDERISLSDSARPFLRTLRKESGATAFLLIRRKTKAVCVYRLVGKSARTLVLGLGGSMPLYAGAGPRALLANMSRLERMEVLDHFDLLGKTTLGVPSRATMEHDIGQDLQRGYSLSDGDVTPGIAAIGAPVFNHRGELAGAISISGLCDSILSDLEGTSSLVMEAAQGISAEIGYKVSPNKERS